MNGSGPARAPPKENSPYSRSLCIFFCLVRLVKRDVLNTRKRPATGVPALPGFSYFASISTSTAPTYITYTRTRTRACIRERSNTRAEFMGRPTTTTWNTFGSRKLLIILIVCRKIVPASESFEKAGSSVTNFPFSFRELKRLSGESGEEGLTRETAWR